MTNFNDLVALATEWHLALPPRLRAYLKERGITDEVIDLHLLGWTGFRIAIPIFDRHGTLSFFKLAKDPADPTPSPKMLASPGSSADLYGWERVKAKPCRIVICEGEFDRLVLESRGIAAVTSTGGASVFHPEWAEAFSEIPEVVICFDRDEAGRAGALKVARLIPQARIAELPEDVGEGGDVTDFFVRLGREVRDFLALLDGAESLPGIPTEDHPERTPAPRDPEAADRIARLKSAVPIVSVVETYVDLRPSRGTLRGRCPFHDDSTPSFVVYPRTQSFHCFGCQKHGDVLTFLMAIANLTFPQAVEALERLSHHEGGSDARG
jgi:DNA primase